MTGSNNNTLQRRHDIELIRIFSAFAIVWYHSGARGHEIAYTGLMVFLMLSVYLAGTIATFRMHFIRHAAERLLRPWIFWTIVYGTINTIQDKPLFPYSHGFIAGLLSGTSIHLWYMPFIFANLVLFGIAQKHAVKPMLAVAGGIGGAIVLSTTMIWRLPSIQFGYPVAQYAHALPSIFIGIFFAYFYLLPKMVRLILLLLILIATFCSISIEGVGIPYLLAILTMLAIVTKPFEGVSIGRLTAVSQCTLGIYFIHIIVLSAIRKYEIADGALLPILAFAASTALVLLMSKLLPMQRKYWM